MKLITNIKKSALRVATAVMALLPLVAFTSCNDLFSEQEGDCSVTYRLKFCYDRNLKWADAFANEVSSVHAYAFDQSGVLVWHRDEQVDQATADNYSMLLDLPAGDYKILAWCGLRNDADEESFSVPEARVGETTIEELQCKMRRYYDEAGAYSHKKLHRLFHGTKDVSLPEDEDGGHYVYTVPLTKNTNHIRVILQHLSADDLDPNDYVFEIDADNGSLDAHNEPILNDRILYKTWDVHSGEAGVGKDDVNDGTRSIVPVKGVIADLTINRMMAGQKKDLLLHIYDKNKEKRIAKIPVIDYALLAKGYYEEEYGHLMTDQEFLDREDEYTLTLFLDDDHEWISSQILIHSWRVVPNDVEIN